MDKAHVEYESCSWAPGRARRAVLSWGGVWALESCDCLPLYNWWALSTETVGSGMGESAPNYSVPHCRDIAYWLPCSHGGESCHLFYALFKLPKLFFSVIYRIQFSSNFSLQIRKFRENSSCTRNQSAADFWISQNQHWFSCACIRCRHQNMS